MCHYVETKEQAELIIVRPTKNRDQILFITGSKKSFPTQKLQKLALTELPEDICPIIARVATIDGLIGEIIFSEHELCLKIAKDSSRVKVKKEVLEILKNYNPG